MHSLIKACLRYWRTQSAPPAAVVGTLQDWDKAFGNAGWFLPPYIRTGELSQLAAKIDLRGSLHSQDELETGLMMFYGAGSLAPMVMHRYPLAPIIQEFRETIAEAVEAHFFGLHHIAVGGLLPVIEGAGRQLAEQRGLPYKDNVSTQKVFATLAEDCKQESVRRNLGAPTEIASMMDSFVRFVEGHLYIRSNKYSLSDKTNRHGILHGVFGDADYGRPLNFYKTIATVDFLTLVSSFRANISWMAPDQTPESRKLATYYLTLLARRKARVR
jgi:hypothetical protein